jgi:hypothetical protein
MPAFPIRSTQQLAEFVIPVTSEMATEIIAKANEAEDGIVYAAVYYFTGTPEKKKRSSILLMINLEFADNCLAYVHMDEYHPRKDGKADLIYKTEHFIPA